MGAKRFLRRLPNRGVRESAHILYEFAARKTLTSGFAGGTVFDEDWDVLVICDACRVDLMAEVADEYDWLPRPAPIQSNAKDSVAGSSKEWLERTTDRAADDELANTAYVTGNPFSATVFNDDHSWGLLDEVWRDAWDDDAGTIRPEPLVERAVRAARHADTDRVIVHLMQPHAPFVDHQDIHSGYRPEKWGSPDAVRDPDQQGLDVWHRIRRGELDRDRVWSAYQDNLRMALDAVDDLRRNVDGTVAITADHGNALGERAVWGHPDVPVSTIREVPWATVSATDEETLSLPARSPTDSRNEPETDATEADVESRLQALGYTE